MKKTLLVLALILALSCTAFGATSVTKFAQTKDTLTVKSGGTVNWASGSYLKIGGTAVTATAAELNVLAGITTSSQTTLLATGLASLNGGIACDTNAFTVADTSGNTAIAGTLNVTGATTHTGAVTNSSTAVGPGGGNVVYSLYIRKTAAQINAAGASGITLLPAVSGRSYRIINAKIAAYNAAMASTNASSLEIVSDFGGTPVVLWQVLKAQLAQATTAGVGINTMGFGLASTSTVLLADNASFLAQVANKAISLVTTTASTYDWTETSSRGVDVSITYTVE